MRRGLLIWVTAVVVITALCVPSTIRIFELFADRVTPALLALGVGGWVVCTYGPMTLAFLFSRSSRARSSLTANLLFVPTLFLVEMGAEYAVFAMDDGYLSLPLEFAVVPGFLTLLIISLGFFIIVIAGKIDRAHQAT